MFCFGVLFDQQVNKGVDQSFSSLADIMDKLEERNMSMILGHSLSAFSVASLRSEAEVSAY